MAKPLEPRFPCQGFFLFTQEARRHHNAAHRVRDQKAPVANALYFGDNLEVLRESIKDESVDLVYLDPPFNSNVYGGF